MQDKYNFTIEYIIIISIVLLIQYSRSYTLSTCDIKECSYYNKHEYYYMIMKGSNSDGLTVLPYNPTWYYSYKPCHNLLYINQTSLYCYYDSNSKNNIIKDYKNTYYISVIISEHLLRIQFVIILLGLILFVVGALNSYIFILYNESTGGVYYFYLTMIHRYKRKLSVFRSYERVCIKRYFIYQLLTYDTKNNFSGNIGRYNIILNSYDVIIQYYNENFKGIFKNFIFCTDETFNTKKKEFKKLIKQNEHNILT